MKEYNVYINVDSKAKIVTVKNISFSLKQRLGMLFTFWKPADIVFIVKGDIEIIK